MNAIAGAAQQVQAACERAGWGFCFIGGLAVLRWGEARVTRDVDVIVLAPYGSEAPIVARLLDEFTPRGDDPVAFARANRVVLLETEDGVPIDVALGGVPFEERAVARASVGSFIDGVPLRTCSAEDLVVMKAFAARAHDWADIEGIVARQAGSLDVAQILAEAAPLLAVRNDPGRMARLESLLHAPP